MADYKPVCILQTDVDATSLIQSAWTISEDGNLKVLEMPLNAGLASAAKVKYFVKACVLHVHFNDPANGIFKSFTVDLANLPSDA